MNNKIIVRVGQVWAKPDWKIIISKVVPGEAYYKNFEDSEACDRFFGNLDVEGRPLDWSENWQVINEYGPINQE